MSGCQPEKTPYIFRKFRSVLLNRIAVKIAFFLNGFVYANWVSRLPRIQEIYHADNGTIGIVLLFMSLGAVAAMPFTGWMIIRNGSRKITLISLIGYCALVPFIPHMQDLRFLIPLYILIGVATGMLDVAMNAQAVIIEKEYKRPIMTSFHALFSVGMAIGAWCGALFADLRYELPDHFTIVIVASLAAAFWVSRNLVQDKPGTPAGDDPLFRIPRGPLVVVGIIAFCCMMGEGAMSDWTVNYMENIAGTSKSFAPLALSAFATAMTLGRIFGDRLRAAFGDTKMIIGGGVIATIGLLLAVLIPTQYISTSGFFLVGIGLSTIVPITYSIAGNAKGLPPGVGLAMVTTVGYSGFLFGPPLIGFIADVYDLRIGLGFVLMLLLLMTILGLTRKGKNA